MNIPTPHINAKSPDEIAKTVLMPGDPLRAKFIAENFLTDVTQYNAVRGMLGFTGVYSGKRVSVQGSGMGMPSMGIYSYELFHYYGVENIIRVGTAGGIRSDVKIRDIIFGMGASTNSDFARQYNLPGTFAPLADFGLLRTAVACAERRELAYRVGNILSSDTFYADNPEQAANWQKMGILAVEMEAAALFMNAARLGKKALCILTVSDVPGEATSAKEREKAFTDMMLAALDTAAAM
ncbi:MAG: purine-nucleoside phosphorylase [Oscillospiraceae bacterium]|nr:purine-nucleoside phosphorylase [Oscillospiraceae bacterium]